ncbi:glycosyltransferase family 2 protein [Roseobacter weihaiensis]|uniref:glycosyltransferase family 2 protein n=1 Tax=Roseobacter weihaiensis TaxID=2763262 RepID=UPI001D0BE3AC|nr:glycosyltransferase family 2 protein [Roseobacter sp. H9]
MAHDILISIINYRTGPLTLACVRSVLADLDGIDGRVVVVDNASGDGSAEEIAAWIAAHPDAPVELVHSATNTGFSGGHNQGMGAHDARYYLLLNSDAELRPGFLHRILEAAEAQPDAGLIAPRLEGEDGQPQVSLFRFHSPLGELIRGAATGPVTRLFKHHDVPLGLDPDPAQIDWASFACILLKGEMVRALGPMDEGYFLYFEDAEYCLRAKRAGWKIIHTPKAVAVHFRGGSGPVKAMEAARRRRPRYYYRARARFMYQAHGAAGLLAANTLWTLGRAISYLRLIAGRQLPGTIEGEARDIWINTRHPLDTRRAVED